VNIKEEGFIGGFLVLGFVIFLLGFLIGLFAVAFIPIKPDYTALMFLVSIFAFIAGMATVALLLVVVKAREINRKPS